MGNVLACCTVVERQANDDSMETTEESPIVKAAIAKELLKLKRSKEEQKIESNANQEEENLSHLATLPFKMFGPFWSVWCKMALAEVGVSLP